VLTYLRFRQLNLSTQAGYRLIFSTEGNAVGKVVRWIGNVGCQFEMGTSIGITRRDIAKNKVIRFYYCVFHYDRILKTERYVSVQVVLLLTLTVPYQGFDLEVVLKYGNGDISQSSWVSIRSKDELARLADHYFDNPQHNYFMESNKTKLLTTKRKSVCQVWMKGDYIVMSRSLHTRIPSLSVIIRKTFSPARTNWGGILGKSQVRWE
jgi:hypothetical protein